MHLFSATIGEGLYEFAHLSILIVCLPFQQFIVLCIIHTSLP